MIEIYTQNLDNTWFAVALQQQQIVTSSFSPTQQVSLKNVLDKLPFGLPFKVFHQPSAQAKTALASLKRIYDGQGIGEALPLSTGNLPTYTKRVLKATSAIPVGYVSTYGSIAKTVGGGPRAVGNIMAGNPFAPIIPCHRVVKANFSLGGYGGGLRVKVELLRREQRGFVDVSEVQVEGRALALYPVEYVLRNLA